VSLSANTAEIVSGHYRLQRGKVLVIPNAVPGERFAPPTPVDKALARAELGIDAESFLVLSVGDLVPEKGVDLTIKSLSHRTRVRLLVAGEGPLRQTLENLAAEHLGDRASFLGSVRDPRPLYAAADLLMLPSRGGDSMPAVLIEAGLSGLPAITCPIGAISEVVKDHKTGLLVDPCDPESLSRAVDEMLAHKDLAQRFGTRAREHCAQHFTIAATAPMWNELINSVIE
jgi:glycosyltransferase involved in cell wall biosynthesis